MPLAPSNTPLRILAGPTAAGKTALAVDLAQATGRVVLSTDSMQVYRGMAIGTAQPTLEELAAAPHRLIACAEPGEEFHAGRFVSEAEAILSREPALVVGGTGMWIRALIDGLLEGAPRDEAVRARLEGELAREGLDTLRERLRLLDPEREAAINPNDALRVLRALEVIELTGRPMSALMAEGRAARPPHPARIVVLTRPRPVLNARIEARVDAMLAGGWIEEARALMEAGLSEDSQAAKALGYRHLFAHLRGEIGITEAADLIKRDTRRFAKRQMTWFRAWKDAAWVDLEDCEGEEVLRKVREHLEI
ncbi:MAG: tRNA (adenosine(37)-N6)-dimethylallyltransferase MiaA [Sumerlaeia bacterium]